MKSILTAIFFLLITQYGFANGWTSSGGGLFVTNENNPWFMGNEPVTWCIDHGGKEQFSLPLDEAKIEIEKGLNVIINQLEFSNISTTEVRDPVAFWNENSILYRTCGVLSKNNGNEENYVKECHSENKERILISDKFQYSENCQSADLEIILGNKQNPKIKELINRIGENSFKKIAGITIRTEYSEKTLRGKGFIYIASDIGENQYSGPRNLVFPNKTIWNTHHTITEQTKRPLTLKTNFRLSGLKLNLKEEVISPLRPLIAHEFSHVLGFQHNHYKNLMDEDYPAEVIKVGVEFKGNFNRVNSIISSGLNEGSIPKFIGFEWNQANEVGRSLEEIKMNSPLIFNFLYQDAKFINGKILPKDLIFIYKATDLNTGNQGLTGINIAEVDLKNKKYVPIKKYVTRVDLTKGCDRPNTIDSVTLKHSNASTNTLETIPLISLGTMTKCGTISLEPNNPSKLIVFKLIHNYFQDNSVLELMDPRNPLVNIRLILKRSDILFSDYMPNYPAPSLTFGFNNL